MLQRIELLTDSRGFVRNICVRLCLVEWNSTKHFTQAVPFPWDFDLRCWSNLPVFHSPYRRMKKFSHLLWLKRVCIVTNFSFFVFFFSTRATAELHQSLPGETRIGARGNRWGLSALCEMMKQAVYAVLSHVFNSICLPWKYLGRSVHLNFTPSPMIR